MKFFSFKILVICTFLPPVLYIVSVLYIENYLKKSYSNEIMGIYIGDVKILFNGDIPLRDAVHQNIEQYLQKKKLIKWGVKVNITIATKNGKLIYPGIFYEKGDQIFQTDPITTAEDNFRLLNEGIVGTVDLKLEHNTIFANSILLAYILLSLILLYYYYKIGTYKVKKEALRKDLEIDRLLELGNQHSEKLNNLETERNKNITVLGKMKLQLKDEKSRASSNEDDMIAEMIALEDKISKNLELQIIQRAEISTLTEQMQKYENLKGQKQNKKDVNLVRKRFKALYKNIIIEERAINGFIELDEDMKIKGEEVIHKLNEDINLIKIKRKVFMKKRKNVILEVVFAYTGRLYFQRIKNNKIQVVTIGTKRTQLNDLNFLETM